MPNPFQDTAQALKALRDKLNFNTYTAVFGRTVEERQRATAEATALTKQIELVLGSAFDAASSLSSLAAAPLSAGGLFATLHNFLAVIDHPEPSRMEAGSAPCQRLPGL